MSLGDRLRLERMRRKMTLAELARASGLSKGFLSQVESGRSNASLKSLHRISACLGISLADLLSEEHATAGHGHSMQEAVRVVRMRDIRPSAEPATLLGDLPEGVLAGVTLPAGGALVSEGDSHAGPTTFSTSPVGASASLMLCVVVKGSVVLRAGESSMMLFAGDVAVWDGSRPYSVENTDRAPASLYLLVPRGLDLPVPSGRYPRPTRVVGPVPAEGPFRLVAMRAQRSTARRD
jgi:transcriptional regulator with XRE-family HTH domain